MGPLSGMPGRAGGTHWGTCTEGARTGETGDRASSAWRVHSCEPGWPGEWDEGIRLALPDPTLTLRVGATVVEPTAAAGAHLDTQQ